MVLLMIELSWEMELQMSWKALICSCFFSSSKSVSSLVSVDMLLLVVKCTEGVGS